MITKEFIKDLAVKFQTTEDNIAREYCQHLFLSYLNKLKGSQKLLFKGGTALRIIFQSPRFSEDLDFSAINSGNITVEEINQLVDEVLFKMLEEGIQVKKNLNPETDRQTSGGYFSIIGIKMLDFSSELQMQVSFRSPDKAVGNTTIVDNNFVVPYLIHYLDEKILVLEKIEALLFRKKPRDFFDLFFILRNPTLVKNVPVRVGLKAEIFKAIDDAGEFEKELKIFLPISFHPILKDFKERLKKEIEIHIS